MRTYRRKQAKIEYREDEHGPYAIIFTKMGQEIMVDVEDVPLVQYYSWRVKIKSERYTNYAYTHLPTDIPKKPKSMAMHRMIMQTPDHLVVDHLDRNGLNNRRYNLENVTHEENLRRGNKRGRKPRR